MCLTRSREGRGKSNRGSLAEAAVNLEARTELRRAAPQVFEPIARTRGRFVEPNALIADLQHEIERGNFDTDIDTRRARVPDNIVQNLFKHWKNISAQFQRQPNLPTIAGSMELERDPAQHRLRGLLHSKRQFIDVVTRRIEKPDDVP